MSDGRLAEGERRFFPSLPWRVGGRDWRFERPLLMGVLNASPDSFSGEDVIVRSEAEAHRRGTALIEAGADLDGEDAP